MSLRDDFVLKNLKEGYLVGGIIRDFLLGKKTYDRDIAVKDAEHYAQNIAEKFDGYFITLDGENRIYRVVLPDKINYLDISELVGNSIEEDLQRRDFTINAIAYNLQTDEYIDTTGGMNDIEQGVLRQIKDENFEDDPLRILRAFRFFATTGFEFAPELRNAINKYKHLLVKPAKERVMQEIIKLFGGKYTSKALLLMDEFSILEMIFPCVAEFKKVPPNSHHHLDLFHHLVESVRQIELLYENSSIDIKQHLDSCDFGGGTRLAHLKLATFLHDIGKFSTWTIEETGRHRFIGHDVEGESLCKPMLKSMKFSNKQIEYISKMIRNHIYPSNVISAPDLSEKVMMRYLRKMGNDVIDNIMLAKADRLSARGVDITEEMVNSNISGLDKLLNFYFAKKDSLKPIPKLLSGEDVMLVLGIKQSPVLGRILNSLHEAQLSDEIKTKEDAIIFIKNVFEEMKLESSTDF